MKKIIPKYCPKDGTKLKWGPWIDLNTKYPYDSLTGRKKMICSLFCPVDTEDHFRHAFYMISASAICLDKFK